MPPNTLGKAAGRRNFQTVCQRDASGDRPSSIYLGSTVWVQMTAAEGESWSVRYDYFARPERRDLVRAALTPGTDGHALYPALDVTPEDVRVEKTRFSPFVPGTSDFERRLAARGIDTLLIAGTQTNICCESTARDAMMRNFKVVMVADATAAYTDDEHNAAPSTLIQLFADVRSSAEVIACLDP